MLRFYLHEPDLALVSAFCLAADETKERKKLTAAEKLVYALLMDSDMPPRLRTVNRLLGLTCRWLERRVGVISQ
jgi:hypothetical protein